MKKIKLDIQMFADGKVVIDTDLNEKGFSNGLSKMQSIASKGFRFIAKSVGVVSGAISVALGGMVKIGSDFESQMSRVKAISGATEKEFENLKKQAMDLGKETAFSSSEAAKGMENLAAAGFSVNETMEAMPGLLDLAAASGEDLSIASDIAAAAVRGFGLEASETSHVADVLAANANKTNSSVIETGEALKYIAPFANAAGISLEETAAAIGIMANAGIQGSQAGTTLRGSLARLSKPTDAMIDAMDELGISFYNSDGKMKSLSEQIEMLEEAMEGLTDEEKNNYLVTLYGQESLSGMLALINEGSGEINNLTKEFENANGIAKETAETMQKNLKGSVEQLKGSIETLGITIFDSLVEPLTNGTNDITEIINGMIESFEKDGFKGLAIALGDGIANIITALVNETPKFIEVAMLIIQNLITGIQNNLPTIVQGAMTIISTFTTAVLDMLPQILQLGIDLVIELIKGIGQEAPTLIPKIVETILKLFLTLTSPENLDRLAEAGIKLIIGLIQGIIMSIPKLLENGEATLKALLNVLSGGQSLMAKIGWSLLKALIKGLGETLDKLGEKAKEIINTLVGKFKKGISKIKDVGKQLINGLWQGIQEKWDSFKNKVSDLGKGIVKKFKDVFGIRSPSRVFRDEIGKQLSAGIGVGFEDELNNVYNDMQRAIDLETGKMSANVQTSGTYQMAMVGVPTFNLLDNTNNTTQLVVNSKVLAEVVNTENRTREVAKA